MLAYRRHRIQESLEQADKVRQEAEVQRAGFQRELEEARKTSQEAAARATQETEKMREAILAEARREAEQIREQAHQQIEIERSQATDELQRQVVDRSASGNVVVSPLSVSLALGMTYNGAAGETEAAMAQTLGATGMSREELIQAFIALKEHELARFRKHVTDWEFQEYSYHF